MSASGSGDSPQELTRQVDALIQQPLMRGLADADGECAGEMVRRQAAFARDCVQGHAAVEVFQRWFCLAIRS